MIKRYENYIMLKITKYLWTKKHGLLINASFTGYFASKEGKGWNQVYEMSCLFAEWSRSTWCKQLK